MSHILQVGFKGKLLKRGIYQQRCLMNLSAFSLSLFIGIAQPLYDLSTESILTMVAQTAYAQEVIHTPRLSQIIQSTLTQNPAAQARRFNLQAAQRGLDAAKGLFDLQLSGTLDLSDDLVTIPNPLEMGARTPIDTQRYSAEISVIQPLRWGTQLSFGLRQSQIETTNPFRNCVPGIISDRCFESRMTLSLTQPLLRGSSSSANMTEEESAKYSVEGAREQLRIELNQRAQSIGSAYLQLSLAQAKLRLERDLLGLTERRLTEAQERLKMGLVAASDLFPLQAAIAQRAQSVMSSEGQIVDAQMRLSTQTNMRVDVASFPHEWLVPQRLERTLQSLAASKVESTPQVRSLLATIKQLKAQREPLHDAQRPQLNMALVWSQSGLGEALGDALGALPNNESRFYGVTLSYAQALSQRAHHLSAQLEAQVKAQEAEQEALMQELKLSWQLALHKVKRGQSLLKLAYTAQQATEQSALVASAKLSEGRGTLFEVLEIQNQALSSQTQVIIIEHEIAQGLLELWTLNDELLDRFGVELK